MKILTGDIGGTKTLLRITEMGRNLSRVCFEKRYMSGDFTSLEPMVLQFLAEAGEMHIESACFAVAGPVRRVDQSTHSRITNLPWVLDSAALATKCGLPHVQLVNDFEAVGYGIDELAGDDLALLRAGVPDRSRPRLVLGAGTGLGVCQLIPSADGTQVFPSEGGHVDFGPTSELQQDFLRFMWRRHGSRVSYDRVVSGPGLEALFEFLVDSEKAGDDTGVRQILAAEDIPLAISASQAEVQLARRAVDLFLQIYGAQAGNLALVTLAMGGVYIAGGIAPKLLNELRRGGFVEGFLDKGRLRPLLENIPVQVVMRSDVGLMGAAALARRAVKIIY